MTLFEQSGQFFGTRMIAKGLDFPNVKLVGIIDADTAIDLPDFRAAERTYQLVSQVCGRCGRGEGVATAIVQTFNPDAPAIYQASKGQYVKFATDELAFRAASHVPPISRMARFVIRDREFTQAAGRADALVDRLRAISQTDVVVSSAAACVLPRIADHYRFDITLTAGTAIISYSSKTVHQNKPNISCRYRPYITAVT